MAWWQIIFSAREYEPPDGRDADVGWAWDVERVGRAPYDRRRGLEGARRRRQASALAGDSRRSSLAREDSGRPVALSRQRSTPHRPGAGRHRRSRDVGAHEGLAKQRLRRWNHAGGRAAALSVATYSLVRGLPASLHHNLQRAPATSTVPPDPPSRRRRAAARRERPSSRSSRGREVRSPSLRRAPSTWM